MPSVYYISAFEHDCGLHLSKDILQQLSRRRGLADRWQTSRIPIYVASMDKAHLRSGGDSDF